MNSIAAKAPKMVLVKPEEYSHQPLTKESLIALSESFEKIRPNLELFYAYAVEGTILSKIIAATSKTSFMTQVLEKARTESRFSNNFVGFLDGSHTDYRMVSVNFPWISIYIDYFSSTPIPENLAAVGDANASLVSLAKIVSENRTFYDSMLSGVKLPIVDGQKSTFSAKNIDDISFTVFGNDIPVTPKMISSNSSTVEFDGSTYYNGLPKDRVNYPTLLMKEDSKVSLRIKNNTTDKFYMVIPAINGIPMKLDRCSFYFDGFQNSSFPLSNLTPLPQYIKPGQEIDFDGLYVNRMGLSKSNNELFSYIGDISGDEGLSYLLARIFDKHVTGEQLEMLDSINNLYLKQQIVSASRKDAAKQFTSFLGQARSTPIYISRPHIADDKASKQLDNPFLGSLGFVVVEVSRPPIKARHSCSIDSVSFRDGQMKSMGGGGLAHISGGYDSSAQRADFWETMEYDTFLHTFKGYVPLNIMSLRD